MKLNLARLKKPTSLPKRSHQKKLTFLEHIQELRKRAYIVAIVFFATSTLGYVIYPTLLNFLVHLYHQELFYTTPTSGLDIAFKISLGVGACLTVPVLLFELFQFIKPAIPKVSFKNFFIISSISLILLILGMAFAYYVTLPATLLFLTTFHTDQVTYFISASSYISFVLQYLLVFGIIFQLPLLLLIVNSVFTIEIKSLMKYQTWVIVACFTAAAIFTPTPDPVNQCIMAIPLLILYELSVGIIYIVNRKKKEIG
jgi:sec-independent protein translocase protein TatC